MRAADCPAHDSRCTAELCIFVDPAHPGFADLERLRKLAEPPEPILQFFTFTHLPKELGDVSKPFCLLATEIVQTLPRNAERTVALRKLLESKDAAVRARLAKT